jgi:hypothetical protein
MSTRASLRSREGFVRVRSLKLKSIRIESAEDVVRQISVWDHARFHGGKEKPIINPKHVGIGQLNGFPIDEFFERRKGEIAEDLVADFADTFPTLASEVKDAWEELEALAPERFPGCSSVRPCLRASPSHRPRLPSIGQDGSQFAKGPKRNVCLW